MPGPVRQAEAARLDLFDRWFVPIALAILVVAAALRLPELALNPFHHDEGVNGYFMTNLVRNGTYVYDPANYHGPSLYYFALLSEILFGLTTEAMRLVPVVFGLLLVASRSACAPRSAPSRCLPPAPCWRSRRRPSTCRATSSTRRCS